MLLQGEQEIDELIDENDEIIAFKYSITSYGADYPVDGLVRRIKNKDIVIPAFQRGYVWSLKEASRFVESLLLGLPVPSIFLSREPETQKLLVIDGQQRLLTLTHFYDGLWPMTKKEFALKGVISQYEGCSYNQLADEAKRRLADSIIHAIVVKQDEPSEDSSSIFHIFERLNTSGVSLTPQEIRTAIYHGKFSDMLKAINQNPAWRSIYGPANKLMRDQELILRFLALFYDGSHYKQPMKGFLNAFMARHQNLNQEQEDAMSKLFADVISFVFETIGKRAFKSPRVLNAAVFDSVMVGMAKRLQKGTVKSRTSVAPRYEQLIQGSEFRTVAGRATANEENVDLRLRLAEQAFADLL